MAAESQIAIRIILKIKFNNDTIVFFGNGQEPTMEMSGMGLVRLAGFEPAAYGLEVRCSIQLSYRRP